MKLSELSEGEACEIIENNAEGAVGRRLAELGITDGERIVCELVGAKRTLLAFRVRGSLIAVRSENAEKIEIKRL